MTDPSPGLSVDLNVISNKVADANAAITAEMLGAPVTVGPPTERTEVLNWMNGLDYFDENDNDSTTDTRNRMGDPLHVRPAPVIYGGTEENPDMVIFNATNDGYLHAIDADDGSELWSFVPRQLLSRMHALFEDDLSATRAYGLDGEIMPIILNNNDMPGISGSERVILLFGMRRGGTALFAVEVTDRNDPQLLWEISADDADFADMGQSWSMPQYALINIGGDDREVAIFGGGYDTVQDSYSVVTDSVGNAIYMVDVLTGAKIWSAGPGAGFDLQLSEMNYSIPAPVKVLDMNYDHKADRMYVGDMGGQVWRFDIANGNDVSSLVDGGVFASLGAAASPTVEATRRFYSQIDVVDVIEHSHRYLSIHLGSGYRAHVLDEDIDEEFYALRDYDVFNQLEGADYGTPIERDDMTDITDIVDPELDATSAGWRLTLDIADGEKSLSRAISFAGSIYFTTFAPQSRESVCDVKLGTNWLYKVKVLNGNPVVADTPEPEDRTSDLQQGGIAPEIIFLFPKDRPDKPVICVGLECEDSNIVSVPSKSYWTKDGS
jgi:type IV pilus assembly protein PilY1